MRSYWSAENTTMHQVRLMHGNILIDEHDLVSPIFVGKPSSLGGPDMTWLGSMSRICALPLAIV
jgi:hypothetical protein